jgi:hypothetical protein
MKERSNVERAAEGFGVSEKLELFESQFGQLALRMQFYA